MSDHPFAVVDPFDPAAPDEETEWRALARALRLADRFTLLFARCNLHDQRQRLIAALRTERPELAVQEIHFSEPITHLLDALRERLRPPLPGAVFVSGLEYSLPTATDAHATPFVANLNAARNSFPLVVPCPLVLWVPEYVLTAIMRGAPDFFSIRSGVYYFAAMPGETIHLIESMTAGEAWTVANLPLAEKQERIAAIESLLADYQALPPAQRDRRAEARLLTRLGTLYDTLGRWVEAKDCYQRSLAIFQEVGDRVGEGQSLDNLGIVYEVQGRWAEAEAAYQQSLAIWREIGNRVGEGRSLNNLGHVHYQWRRWAEAEQYYQQSLEIFREVGDRVGRGQILNNLGNLYHQWRRWAEAEQYYQQSLEIFREVGDHVGEGATLANLGVVYHHRGRQYEAKSALRRSRRLLGVGDRIGKGQTLYNRGIFYKQQGQWMEAETAYQQSLEIFREVGDRISEGTTLKDLAELREAQGDIVGALEFVRQAVAVLEATEDAQTLGEVRELVAKWEGLTEGQSA
jgi:tetratricopeptide (TPR) repeat protein